MLASRLLAAAAVVAPLAACTTSSGGLGQFAPATPQARVSRAGAAAPLRRESWVRPASAHQTLLYVSDFGTQSVTIYSNPSAQTFQLVGQLFGFVAPGGECTDARGDVFITDGTPQVIDEYAHGSVTPKSAISDPEGQPLGCAIDGKTGRLAVTNVSDPSGGEPGNVIVYSSPSGAPVEYSDSRLNEPIFCAFDGKGNLYVDGYDSAFHAVLAELPKGSQQFTILNLNGGSIDFPGGILVKGSQLLVGDYADSKTAKIYQIRITGSTATVVSTISLSNSESIAQFALFGSGAKRSIIAPDYDDSNIDVYSYPDGAPLDSITTGVSLPVGAVFSS